MSGHVGSQVTLVWKAFIADFTSVWLLARVYLHMYATITLCRQNFPTHLTRETDVTWHTWT